MNSAPRMDMYIHTMENKVMDYINRHYDDCKKACIADCVNRGIPFSEDVYHNTLLKVNDIYQTYGLRDTTDNGILNYIWRSFRQNIIREKQYKCNQNAQFVDEMGGSSEDEQSKADMDMFNDFCVDYIYRRIENEPEITDDDYNIYRLKTIANLTYRQMQAKYDWSISQLKHSVTKVRRFIRQHINMKDIKQEYNEQY